MTLGEENSFRRLHPIQSKTKADRRLSRSKLNVILLISCLSTLTFLQVVYQVVYIGNDDNDVKDRYSPKFKTYKNINDLVDYAQDVHEPLQDENSFGSSSTSQTPHLNESDGNTIVSTSRKKPQLKPNMFDNDNENVRFGLKNYDFKNIEQNFSKGDYLLYKNKFPISEMLSDLKSAKFSNQIIEIFNQNLLNSPEICEESSFRSSAVKSSPDSILTNSDMYKVVQTLIKTNVYHNVLRPPQGELNETSNENFKRYVDESWYMFGLSSVWLESYGVHFTVSRIVFSSIGRKDVPKMSFLYSQLYDINWKELKNFQLKIPYNTEGSVKSVNFPKILPIEFSWTKVGKYYGPEDPRIMLYKNQNGFEEPLVIFNMRRPEIHLKRAMHVFFPFSNNLIMLNVEDQPLLKQQKNWSGFISRDSATNSINFIYSIDPLDILRCNLENGACKFIHENNPNIRIDGKKSGPMRGGTSLVSIPNPAFLPIPSNREIWIGFARAHVKKCGCGSDMYRPNLMIFIQDTDTSTGKIFHRIESISRFIDFGIEVPVWGIAEERQKTQQNINAELKKKCFGKSVLIPNSIAYWKIKSVVIEDETLTLEAIEGIKTNKLNTRIKKIWHNSQSKGSLERGHKAANFHEIVNKIKFNDYLGLTLSGADQDNRIVHIYGLLNFIKQIPSLFDHRTNLSDIYQHEYMTTTNQRSNSSLFNIIDCSLDASRDYCYEYGKTHGNAEEIDIAALPS